MKTTRGKLSDLYLVALRDCLTEDTETNLSSAKKLGRKALRLGVSIPDLSLIHEEALLPLLSSVKTAEDYVIMIQQSGAFFRQVLAPFLTVSPEKLQINTIVADLATLKKQLQYETAKRKTAEISRQKSHQQYLRLQADSKVVQKQLRNLSHEFLRAQEDERKRISRELHDEISQILTGINVRLAALKIEVNTNKGSVIRKITNTQRLVEKSVAAVHQFACDLRPAMLDDLGLVPALTTYMKEIRKRTGLLIRFSVSKAVIMDKLNSAKRTVLYRIVQEALTNVTKHAHASRVNVSLQNASDSIILEINDNGKSFAVSKALNNKHCKHLGLIGMRERAEMLGGTFNIESGSGKGTFIRVRIPHRNSNGETASTAPIENDNNSIETHICPETLEIPCSK